MLDPARLRAAYEQAKGELLAERTPAGHWVGELSSSALSTATAVSALAVVRRSVECRMSNVESQTFDLRPSTFDDLISRGVGYLRSQQNPDGGFGDTDLSHSNIATTYLVVAALHLAGVAGENAELLARANAYLDDKGRLTGLRERYGVDKTFVVPIMTNCAIAGLIDWREIDPLPFELATVPQSWYRFIGMPVVSYAIPALVAIGQAQYFHAPPRNPLKRLVRWLSISRSLKVLRRMQPDSGGYLEATPLTSFVVMSLASKGSGFRVQGSEEEVIREGVKFLAASIRPDGSWPIDTNLATWNTTLAINALAGGGEDVAELLGVSAVRSAVPGVPGAPADAAFSAPGTPQRAFPTGNVLDWLLSCQHNQRHPFTGADPGGFGWSDLSGAVPDADDTPGALLAIAVFRLGHQGHDMDCRELDGFDWLVRLQNRNGGWPTFCRGWGRLPFDRSGTDLTAHALRALRVWASELDQHDFWPLDSLRDRMVAALNRGRAFLDSEQHPNGSWSPLWFGNQDHPTEDNPVYGTAKVLMAYRDLGLMDSPEAQRGVAWLVANQNADGGWGSGVWGRARSAELGARSGVDTGRDVTGLTTDNHSVLSTEYSVPSNGPASPSPQPLAPSPLLSSVEETALAVEALLAAQNPEPRTPNPAAAAAEKGLNWLIERVERGEHRQPAPIGFYFAKLWYYERLYPLTFTVAALGRACRAYAHPPTTSATDRAPQPLGSP